MHQLTIVGGGLAGLEHLLDLGYAGWRERQSWRRQGLANGRSGTLEASRRALRPAGRAVR